MQHIGRETLCVGDVTKLERDFSNFWIEFYAGFCEWVNDKLMTNNYKQYFASSGVWTTFSNLLQIIMVRIQQNEYIQVSL